MSQPAGTHLRRRAIDAQREAVPRMLEIRKAGIPASGTRTTEKYASTASLLLALVLVLTPFARAANGGAAVSGIVRDAQGVAQMGALVQILNSNATIKTAFTDQHGHYTILNISPGKYMLRASANLFVPVTRTNLLLGANTTSVINLTLAALFDTTSWLPAERRRADEPDDDWKWTLRSTASRPILRILEDGAVIEVSSSASEQRKPQETRVRETLSGGDGEFGAGGVHDILAIHHSLDDGSDTMLRVDMATNRVPTAYAPSQEIDAGYERSSGFNSATRMTVTYMAHPELIGTGSALGLDAMEIKTAQRMSLGEQVEVEAGGNMTAVRTVSNAIAMHPFLRVTAHPMGVWSLHYRMATDRQMQGFEDATTDGSEVPVALVRNGRLALESGRHQEASVARKVGRVTVEAAYYHDTMSQISVQGGELSTPARTAANPIADMLIDPTTGSFKTLAAGYNTSGMRVTASAPILTSLWIAAEYSTGDALQSNAGPSTTYTAALAGLAAHNSATATLAVKGRIPLTGTRIRASYRWQPSSLVTAVDPYSLFGDQAYLSCMVRQPIRLRGRFPQGLDATIDVTNLLANGYRPFLSADGQTLYFAQTPRTLQAGLSLTF
jgi:Carboxypeptidase regulatory-like domain